MRAARGGTLSLWQSRSPAGTSRATPLALTVELLPSDSGVLWVRTATPTTMMIKTPTPAARRTPTYRVRRKPMMLSRKDEKKI